MSVLLCVKTSCHSLYHKVQHAVIIGGVRQRDTSYDHGVLGDTN